MLFSKNSRRAKIRKRIRGRIFGTKDRPRLSVFRSNKHIYVQLINDTVGKTICSASSKDLSENTSNTKADIAYLVGKTVGGKSVEAGITKVTFDRNGYLYHGRIKALADGAREAGLVF